MDSPKGYDTLIPLVLQTMSCSLCTGEQNERIYLKEQKEKERKKKKEAFSLKNVKMINLQAQEAPHHLLRFKTFQ